MSQALEGLCYSAGTRLGALGSGDPIHVLPLVAVGEAGERFPRSVVAGQRRDEVLGHLDHSGVVVPLEDHFHHLPGCDSGSRPVLAVEREQEVSAHRGDGAAICVAVDVDPYRHPLLGSQGLHHLGWHVEERGRLSVRLDPGLEPVHHQVEATRVVRSRLEEAVWRSTWS